MDRLERKEDAYMRILISSFIQTLRFLPGPCPADAVKREAFSSSVKPYFFKRSKLTSAESQVKSQRRRDH